MTCSSIPLTSQHSSCLYSLFTDCFLSRTLLCVEIAVPDCTCHGCSPAPVVHFGASFWTDSSLGWLLGDEGASNLLAALGNGFAFTWRHHGVALNGLHSSTKAVLQHVLIMYMKQFLCGQTQVGGNDKIHLRKRKTGTSAPPVVAMGEQPEHCYCQEDALLRWFIWWVEKTPQFKTLTKTFLWCVLHLLCGAPGLGSTSVGCCLVLFLNVNDHLADSSQVCVRSVKPQSLYGAILIMVSSGSDFFVYSA